MQPIFQNDVRDFVREERVENIQETFNKERRKNQSDNKNTINEIKNTFNGIK